MSQAIITRLHWSERLGYRVSATSASGLRVYIEATCHGAGWRDDHTAALRELCQRYQWYGIYTPGCHADGSITWVAWNLCESVNLRKNPLGPLADDDPGV